MTCPTCDGEGHVIVLLRSWGLTPTEERRPCPDCHRPDELEEDPDAA